MATRGTWFGLPDFTITENISALLGGTGSMTNPGNTRQASMFYNPAAVAQPQSSGNVLGASTTKPVSNYPGLSGNVPAGTTFGAPQQQAPTAPPPSSGGGGGGNTSDYSRVLSEMQSGQRQWDDNVLAQLQQGAQSQADAELQSALSGFDYEREQALAQRSRLGTEKTTALSDLQAAFGRSQKQAETSKTEAESATRKATDKALSTAKDVQGSNRNVLRALGILSSSAAGEMLGRPMEEYATQAADLQASLLQRKNYVDTWLEERMGEHQNAVRDINQQYTDLIGKIDSDLRFNDRQRTDAIRQAQAALQARISEIQQSAQQYQMSARNYTDQVLGQIAQLQLYQNPQADISGIQNTLLTRALGQERSPMTVGITQDEQKRKTLSGLG